MKKIFLLFTAAAMAVGVASAQDTVVQDSVALNLNKAIELANQGQEAFGMGENGLALEAFKNSLVIAEGLGEAGIEHANTCKTAICVIYLNLSKDMLKAGDYEGALAKLNETITIAGEYGMNDTVLEAQGLIPDVYMTQGNNALRGKDMNGAIAFYAKVLELNPQNGDALLRTGMAYGALGNIEEATKAYEAAIANGEEKAATKQLSNLYLKKANACLKAKSYQESIDNAVKANSYLENATAYKIAASAAQKLNKNSQCIEFYQKYLEIKPDASDASGIIFTIAALYQKAGNKTKAIEYYQKVASDPKYGTSAKEQLGVLKQ